MESVTLFGLTWEALSPHRICPICKKHILDHNREEREICFPLIVERLKAKGFNFLA